MDLVTYITGGALTLYIPSLTLKACVNCFYRAIKEKGPLWYRVPYSTIKKKKDQWGLGGLQA
jgi:hypothetical protein